MTRVVQVMAGARHGGAEAFFFRLVNSLSRAGIEEHVIIRRNKERAQTQHQTRHSAGETKAAKGAKPTAAAGRGDFV